MKKFNLFKMLAVLIVLITSINTSWAYWWVPGTIHNNGSFNSSLTDPASGGITQMSGSNEITFYNVPAGTNEFKLVKGSDWGHGNFNNKTTSIITTLCSNCSNGNNKIITNAAADITFKITDEGTWWCDVTASTPTYYIKYNWNNSGWAWSGALTSNGGNMYSCTGQYGGSGSYDHTRLSSTDQDGTNTTATVNNSPSTGDKCVFSYNASTKALTITRCNKVNTTNKIYFDNSKTQFTGNLYLVIGRDKPTAYSKVYALTQKAGTQLYYLSNSSDSWDDATYYAIVANSSTLDNSDTGWGSSSLSSKGNNGYTAAYTSKYDLGNDRYLITTAGSSSGTTISITNKSTSYTQLNFTQTATLCTKAYGAATYSANTSSLTSLNIQSYYLTAENTVSVQQTYNMNGSTGVASGSACQAATTTINVGDAPASWVYDGIYTGMNSGSRISEDQVYSYYPSAATTYYVRFHEVHDPSVSLAASSSYLTTTSGLRALTDEAITLTATTMYTVGSPVDYTYEYSTDAGSNWTKIAESNSSTQTFTPTSTGDYVFRVTLPEETGDPSATTNVHVTEMYRIKVKKNASWTPTYLYIWSKDNEITQHGAFPGASGKFTNHGQWYEFDLNSDFDSFIVSDDGSGTNHTADKNSVTSDGCYTIGGTTGTSCSVSSETCPSAPSVTTNEATVNSSTSLTFNYSVGANRDRTTPGVAYKQSDSNIDDAATIYSSGTHFDGSAINDGNVAGTISNKTITAGKDWYYVAYGTNGYGTTYGSILKIRTTALTLDRAGASTGTTSVVAVGGKAMPSITKPSKTGYNFGGYWTSAGGSGTKYYNADGSSATTWKTNGSASETLTAYWTAKTSTVTLDINGATSGSNQTVLATYGASMPLVTTAVGTPAISVPSKTGYTLLGYWDATTNGNQYYAYGGTPAALSSYQNWNKEDATKTLYARWQANTYTLTLKKYNGQDDAEATATYDATISVTPPTKTGYTFKGYYTASSGGTQIIAADGHFVASVASWTNSSKQWNHTSDETLHAQWTVHTYTIEFDGNEDGLPNYIGEVSGSTDAIDATYDVEYTLTANGFSREGYTFAGWNTDPDGTSGDNYDDEEEDVSNLTDEDGGTVTLYAKWTGRTYTVTFDARGGSSLSASSATVTMGDLYINGSDLDEALPTVTAPAGYVFQGWYTASSGGTQVTAETRVATASDHTLYAHYLQQTRVYFKNTLDWSEVFVTYDATWRDDQGAGNVGKIYHKMTLLDEEEKIYVDVIPEDIIRSWKFNIAFNSQQLGKINDNWTGDYTGFDKGSVVFRRDFDSYATMFVPETTKDYDKNKAAYYSTDQWTDWKKDGEGKDYIDDYRYKDGYWRTYNEKECGYVVKGTWDSESLDHAFRSTDPNGNTFSFTRTLEANSDYYFRIYKHCKTSNTYSSWFLASDGSTTITSSITDWVVQAKVAKSETLKKEHIKTTAAGDYTITIKLGDNGILKMDVTYPLVANDYRVLYSWNDGSAHEHASEIIKPEASSSKKISVFVHHKDSVTSRSLKIQQCTTISASGVPTWTDRNTITLSNGLASGVHNFVITQPAEGYPTGAYSEAYDGDYYIRTECAEGKWDFYKDYPDNKMTYSDYSMTQTLSPQYSHYFCRYFGDSRTPEQTDIAYTIANDYSPSISDTLVGDATIGERNTLPTGNPANVRFSWNEKTNALRRAYLKSATGSGNKRYLVLHGTDNKVLDKDGNVIAAEGEGADDLKANELLFSDQGNWIYQVELQAKPGSQASILAKYNGTDRTLQSAGSVIGGEGLTPYSLTAVYDFKTNRLMSAWTPSGDITDKIEDVDLMLIREGAGAGNAITFGTGGSLEANKIIGAIKLDYDDLVGKVANWTETSRPLLKYFISFPFDVNVSDIFGMGRFGREYIIQRYAGEKRAEKGFFRGDGTTTFWENLTTDSVMHAYEGYCVMFDNDYLNDAGSDVWTNKGAGSSVYLYFPSADNVGAISNTDKTITVPQHLCTINRTFIDGGKTLNHQNTDSHWSLIGVPIFNNHTGSGTAGTPGAIFIVDDKENTGEFHYFYKFNNNNTFSIAAASGYTFNTMHCYMVQYYGDVTFTGSAPVPAGVAARRAPENKNYKIELQVTNGTEETTNHTYVELREDANDDFALNEDVYMDLNNVATCIYSYAGDYDVAANVLSVANHTVSVGINVVKAGMCNFSMPSNFDGTVTLIDMYTGARTNLALNDYEVYLEKGAINDRFLLEINIRKVATAIDGADGGSLKDGKAHKFIENGLMYILRDGKVYDAQGNRVK